MVWKKKLATKPKKEHDDYASRLAMWEGAMEHGTLKISERAALNPSFQASFTERQRVLEHCLSGVA